MIDAALVAIIRSELLKQRRGLARLLVWGAGLFVPAILLLLRLRRPSAIPALYRDEAFWDRLWNQAWDPMAHMFYPLAVIVVTSLVTQIEYRDDGWKQLHAAPVRLGAIYLAKLLVALALVGQIMIIFHVGLVAVGVLPRLVVSGVPLPPVPLPLGEFTRRHLVLFFDLLPIVGLQYVLGLLCKNVLLPIGIGGALWTASVAALGWSSNYLLLYNYPAINYSLWTGNRVGRGAPVAVSYLAGGAFVAIALGGYVAYRAKADKG